MTIGRQASAAGTEIVVRVAMVEGQRVIDVLNQLLVQLVLPGDRIHVGRVTRL
jgi:hypothetical protein